MLDFWAFIGYNKVYPIGNNKMKWRLTTMKNVKNLSSYAYTCKYIVARECDGDLWYWGAWNDYETAYRASCEVRGIVITNPEVE